MMEYYYSPPENINEEKSEIEIRGEEYHHLSKSLRKKPGNKITVTDGRLNIFECTIEEIDSEKLICRIDEKKFNLYEPAVDITLYLGVLKNSERFEFAIEKCVELGVRKIIPLLTDYTVVKSRLSRNKTERVKKIILSAMKQSQRCYLPEISETTTFDEMMEQSGGEANKIVLYELADPGAALKKNVFTGKISLCIGPEGGFSREEAGKFENNKWQIMSLGNRKLRAETAAIVSVYKLTHS